MGNIYDDDSYLDKNMKFEELKEHIDLDNPSKEFPSELIINISSIDNPTIAEISTTIRKYIIKCKTLDMNPVVVLNFTITSIHPTSIRLACEISAQTFTTLAEYLQDMKKINDGMQVIVMVRGIALYTLLPLTVVSDVFKISKYTEIHYSNKNTEFSGKFIKYLTDHNIDVNNDLELFEQYINK